MLHIMLVMLMENFDFSPSNILPSGIVGKFGAGQGGGGGSEAQGLVHQKMGPKL